jgi:colicin import membrane protein
VRETRADTQQAILLAIALHVVLFALMFAGLWWTRTAVTVSAAGAPVEAELVDANALSASMRKVLSDRPEPAAPLPEPQPEPEPVEEPVAPPPQPLPAPVPEDAPTPPQSKPQDFIPKPDTTEQAAVVATPTPTPSDEQKLQEEKRRQAQVDLTEQKRQEEAERKRRLAQEAQETAERERKLAEIQRKRAAAAREIELAEQRLKQIADARALAQAGPASTAAGAYSARPPPGNNGTDTGLEARYAAALQEAILSKWTRPETVPVGARCRLVIKQLPGGEVMSAAVSSPRAYDEQGRRSVEAAVLKAQPLPYAGFEKVFARTLTLNFEARDR